MSSVYDDISARLDAEQASIEGQAGGAKRDHDLALADADAEHDAAVQAADSALETAMTPLRARALEVEAIRGFLTQTQGTPADPQTPSATTGDATTSAPDDAPVPPSEPSQPATASSPEPTSVTDSDPAPTSPESPSPEPEPSTPPAADSTPEPEPMPSSESGDSSPQPQPTATEPITVENLGGSEQIDRALPVEVPLTTGEIRIVPAGDLLAAKDASIEDAALTTSQLDLRRNSDWP